MPMLAGDSLAMLPAQVVPALQIQQPAQTVPAQPQQRFIKLLLFSRCSNKRILLLFPLLLLFIRQ
jgi:hypothetical protein